MLYLICPLLKDTQHKVDMHKYVTLDAIVCSMHVPKLDTNMLFIKKKCRQVFTLKIILVVWFRIQAAAGCNEGLITEQHMHCFITQYSLFYSCTVCCEISILLFLFIFSCITLKNQTDASNFIYMIETQGSMRRRWDVALILYFNEDFHCNTSLKMKKINETNHVPTVQLNITQNTRKKADDHQQQQALTHTSTWVQ